MVGSAKTWYSKGIQVETAYLATLLGAEGLANTFGVEMIKHGHVKTYYQLLPKGRLDMAEAAIRYVPALEADVAAEMPVAKLEDLFINLVQQVVLPTPNCISKNQTQPTQPT